MGSKRRPGHRKSRRQQRRERAAALRAQGLPFTEVGRRLGISGQAAHRLIERHAAGDRVQPARCSVCRAVLTTRRFQERTLGEVLCRPCLAARPDAPFALRLRSHRLAAGLSRSEVQAAAGLAVGRLKNLEDRGAKPQQRTRPRLAKVLRAPDLERFGE
jgi:hypothetical protein